MPKLRLFPPIEAIYYKLFLKNKKTKKKEINEIEKALSILNS